MKRWHVTLILIGILILTGVIVVKIDLTIKEKRITNDNIIQIENHKFSITEFFVDDKCYRYYDRGNKGFSLPYNN